MERITQYQYGDGDNVGRDKIVNNYIGKSVEYSELQHRIADKQQLLSYIPEIEVAERLRISEELNALLEQETQFKNEVFRLYEAFTRIEINTERLRLAQQHFDAGEFKEARAVLDSEKMGLELDTLLEQTEILNEKTKEIQQRQSEKANEFLILAQLTAIDFELFDWFERAKEYFELSLKAERNHENLFIYANFLQDHKQFNEAIPLFEEVLRIYRILFEATPDFWLHSIAKTLNNLAILYSAKNEFSVAQPLYEEALELYRGMAEVKAEIWLPSVAMVLNNFGELYRVQNKFSQAQPLYEQALSIRKKLIEIEADIWMPDLALVINNLGLLFYSMKEFTSAKQLYKEALSIRRQLAEADSLNWSPEVARTLNNLANLYTETNELSLAEPMYKEALNISRQFAKINPHIWMPDLAMTLNNSGILYRKRNKFHAAEHSFEEALNIRRHLVVVNPQVWLPDLVIVLNNFANSYHSNNKYDMAQPLYNEALGICRNLSAINPQVWRPYTGNILNNLAGLCLSKNEFTLALSFFEEALTIYRELALYNPKAWSPNIAVSAINIGLIYLRNVPNKEKSLAYVKEALHAALPFVKDLTLAQQVVSLAKKTVRNWGLDADKFLQGNFP